MARSTGTYERTVVAGESVRAFVPRPLPPSRPKLDLGGILAEGLVIAERNLVRLEAAARMVPSLDWFVYAFVRREAVVTSQIEGTQASLTDLLASEAEAPTEASEDHVEEVCNYLEALSYAHRQLSLPRGLPLSVRLLNGAHKRLLAGVRGQGREPGRIRRSQNWVGGARPGNATYVPPPHARVGDLLGDLERFLHEDDRLPPLVRAGLAHAQFETIHPYLDGNGRVGRLLISLCLVEWELLTDPILYVSLFFKRRRDEYYRRLGAIRTEGDWEGWLAFFLEAVATIADEAVALIASLFDLVERDRRRFTASSGATVTGIRLFDHLLRSPIITVSTAVRLGSASRPTATKAIRSLVEAGILVETSGRQRDRTYAYRAYLDLLREETELDD